MENLLNVNQAAFILKVHPLTVRRYIKEKKLKATKAGGNIRIKESDLGEFNQEYTPSHSREQSPTKIKSTLTFSTEDPFLRLKGRGASLKLS